MPASTQPPIIEIGPLLERVPFHRSLYVAEITLDGTIFTFEPRKSTGTPAALKPILGAKTFYRITGDGSTWINFSSDFVKSRDSKIFNRAAGVTNLITFTFDGTVFNYTITPEVAGIEFPRWVGNFGVAGQQLVLAAHTDAVGVIQDTVPPVCTRSAFNLIKSLHYIGETPLIYGVAKDGEGEPWVESEDPKEAFVSFDCTEVGRQTLLIRASALGQPVATRTPIVSVEITVTDTEGYCAP